MKEDNECLEKLALRHIKPTAIRLLVLRAMMNAEQTVSLLDLENLLDNTVDKSSISRAITLFLTHKLIHSVDDGSGSLKYGVCDDHCTCSVADQHTHFYCECCHRTFCLENVHVPVVQVPKGFTLDSVNYVLKGLCAECAKKKK
jgi:Fur family ferric uptake transcriptional regulator